MLENNTNNGNTYGNQNWAWHVKSILENIGMSELWVNQNITKVQLQLCKQRIMDIYTQTWHGEVTTSPGLSSYCPFKHYRTLDSYLDQVNEAKYRIALSKFHLSSHNLEI